MTPTTDVKIEITPEGAGRVTRIADHIESTGHAYGKTSPQHVEMAASWVRTTSQVFGLLAGGGSMWRDGDGLSLCLQTSYGMTVGVVFHRNRDYDAAQVDGTTVGACRTHGRPWVSAVDGCEHHGGDDRCMPMVAPWPGTWSLHS